MRAPPTDINIMFLPEQGAYVLGTITLLVVKSDERTGRYRDMSAVLKEYIGVNEVPPVGCPASLIICL